MKKKILIIAVSVVVVAAGVVLSLFATGVIGKKNGEPVAQAVEATVSQSGYFGDLGKDAFFDVREDRDPATAIDNYVRVNDSKGNKVPMKSTRLENGLYRLSARDGFKERASYQIWLYFGEFVAEQYAPYDTFVFTIAGKGETEEVIVKDGIENTGREGTDVQEYTVGTEVFYTVTLAAAAEQRYQEGDVILAKKPETPILDGDLASMYAGDIEGYAYNGLAAYYVLRESQVVDGREEIDCRLANMSEVLEKADIYKTLEIKEDNLFFDEERLRDAVENSPFAQALLQAAEDTIDFFDQSYTVRREKPKMVLDVHADFEDGDTPEKKVAILNFKFTITIAKGVDIVICLNNTIDILPKVNFQYEIDKEALSFTYECDLGVNVKTKTVCTIDMKTPDTKIYCTTVDEFKEKFKQMVSDQTTEKAICGAEMPIYTLRYPIYCFVFEVEFGVDIDLELKAQISFEYVYTTDMTAGVTLVDGEFNSYKSFDSDQSAKDFVLLGKVTLKGGVYVKFSGTLLSVAGVGLKVKFGAYAEVGGQIRIDMEAALKESKLHVIKGYYVEVGLYLALAFSVKAGIDVPGYGFLGYKNSWDLAETKFPLFERGSKYVIKDFVNPESNVEIQGSSAKFDSVLVNAFDIDKVADANRISVPLEGFNIEYLDDAANYVTLRDGGVYVSPSVGTEFNARVKLIAKSDSYVTGIVNFHKAAVMPTCETTDAKFDKKSASDVTFDVVLNKSEFVSLTGQDITAAFYTVKSSGEITISKSFLNTLPMGEHKFNYNTSRGNIVLTVVVMDSTPITVEKTTATFNKSARANVSFKMNLHGNTITSVEGLTKGEYTVDKSGTFVIYASALMAKETGAYDLIVKASNDTTVELTVTVKDDRAPVLFGSTFSFAKTASLRKAVPVRFEQYGYSVKGVEGNGIAAGDYVVEEGCISIDAGYLSKLAAGSHNFTIKFKLDNKEVAESISITVKENATIIAYTAYAEFDLNAPADVEFIVVSSGNILVSGNGISASNYSISSTNLKIKADFLKGLSLGEYTFSAANGGESTALTVKVINTATPEILSEDVQADGSLALTYDKGDPKPIAFELFLTDKNAFSAEGLQYSLVKTEKGSYKLTVANEFIAALTNGDHEFELLTGTNSLFLTIKVVNTADPTATSQSSLSYVKGSNAVLTVTYSNAKAKVKNIEVKGEGVTADTKAISVEQYAYTVDCETLAATFAIDPSYCEQLTAGYYKVMITFSDENGASEFVTSIVITVT